MTGRQAGVFHALGFVGSPKTIDAPTDRTCRLASATPDRLRELIARNLQGLRSTLEFCAARDIHLYRLSSMVIPFGSHPANTLVWWEEFADELAQIAWRIRSADVRVSLHPGQFTVLSSPRGDVVTAAIRELAYQARLLDALEAGLGTRLVIHGGGAYGDRAAASDRFVSVVNSLPDPIRLRLAIENDERIYSVADTLDISRRTGIPVVFDLLHYRIHSASPPHLEDVVRACRASWPAGERPKMHYSSQASGRPPGAHSAWVHLDELLAFGHTVAATGPPVDVMLECKEKDRALLRARGEAAERGLQLDTGR